MGNQECIVTFCSSGKPRADLPWAKIMVRRYDGHLHFPRSLGYSFNIKVYDIPFITDIWSFWIIGPKYQNNSYTLCLL